MSIPEIRNDKDHLVPENYSQVIHPGRTVQWGVWPGNTCPVCGEAKLAAVADTGKLVPGIAYAAKCPKCSMSFDYGIAISELRMP